MPSPHPRPEDFLERVERGRLKLSLGCAAGVEKTYRILQESHALMRRGVDVVVAFVESPGRSDLRLVREATGLNVQVVSFDEARERRP